MLNRFAGLLGVWAACTFLALADGWRVMWLLAYLVGLLLVVSLAWARLNVSDLELKRQHVRKRVQVGEPLTEEVELAVMRRRTRWWPRLWLEVHDRSDLAGHHLDQVLSLAPFQQKRWTLSSVARRRGRYMLGPVWVTSGDPFGLFRTSRKVADADAVLVYPRSLDLPQFGRVPGDLPGGATQSIQTYYSTPNVSSVREYQPGDAFNRIHWPTTARTGRLMVREFDLDPAADVWLVLDMAFDVHQGEGDDSTEEYAVTAAASLARHLIQKGRSVGLISQPVTLPVDRGPRQSERILETLAVIHASSHLPLDALLPAENSRLSRNSTLVVVTPSTSEGWVAFCQSLAARGVHSMAVLVEAATWGNGPSPLLLVSSLAASHVPVYLLKKGEPIDVALSSPRMSHGGR